MIRIEKPPTAPEKLATDGKRQRRSNSTAYSRNPDAYQAGSKKFEFHRTIYAHPTVKATLVAAQHEKCCFCEKLIGDDGDVEHFRPKQASRQAPGKPLQYPGYYWLAYEWSNLYLACPSCNQRHKQNLFPLENASDRASNHQQKLNQETPLLIDPGIEDPEDFIGFRGEMPYAINNNARGRATIAMLKLDRRANLTESRLQRLQLLKGLYKVTQLAAAQPRNLEIQNLAVQAAAMLRQASQNNAEFAAAARSALQTNFRYVLD